MKNYEETIKMMEADGWFRVNESKTHIFFCKRLVDGNFARKTVEYSK
jgi:predicted RNA binding protein YcfA (HicA-like mRNA interferase family)